MGSMPEEKKVLLSGVKPTGRPHIGNYFGAMKQFTDFQDEFASFIMIADYHALTTIQNADEMRDLTLQVAIDHLATGLDPQKIVFFRQSDVPEHTELTWIFDCIMTVPYLMRSHAYKDAIANGREPSMGLLHYPLVLATDILLYEPDIVPVGADQKQHVEFARDTAEKFNRVFGETFKLPEPFIPEGVVGSVPGIDGKKMSKSYGNHIPLFGEEAEIKSKVMGIVTDSKRPEEPKDPETCNVFALHKLVTNERELAEIKEGYEKGGLSYQESKEKLYKNILSYFGEIREKRKSLENDLDYVRDSLRAGAGQARAKARAKMEEIREKVGLK